MTQEKVFQMKLQTVYPLLVAKAEKKGRTRAEVDQVTCWLTGYSREELASLVESQITYGDFFRNAPAPNPRRKEITGSVCGVRVETMDDPRMQEIRYLDKLVEELDKGKTQEKVMRKEAADNAATAPPGHSEAWRS